MSKKPCIQCGKDCEIFPVQLGDVFTMTYLRVCSAECMFYVAYDYLYKIWHHKDFRNSLFDKQNTEDLAERNAYIDEVTNLSLEMMRKSLQVNPELLTSPMPSIDLFKDFDKMPDCGGVTMRFTRPSKNDRIKWQSAHVDTLREKLIEAVQDLEKMESE